jgi:Na+-transporting NADH:ubiquinone oxidoreductase subunit NqrD
MKNDSMGSHIFWGTDAPLSTLVGAGFMIMATSRLAFAITLAGALIWINVLSALAVSFGEPILPKKGRGILAVFLCSFLGSLYLLRGYVLNPFLAMEITFLIVLAPLSCIGSGLCRRVEALEHEDALSTAFSEAVALGGVLIALALIREPLGFGSLSFPGGVQGMVVLFSAGSSRNFPVLIIANAAGGLLLLGYGLTLFRRFRNRYTGKDTP